MVGGPDSARYSGFIVNLLAPNRSVGAQQQQHQQYALVAGRRQTNAPLAAVNAPLAAGPGGAFSTEGTRVS